MKFLLVLFLLFLNACPRSEPAGYCGHPLEISKDTLSFSAQGGIDSVFVSNSFWRFTGYDLSEHGCEKIFGYDSDYCSNNYCHNNSDIMKFQCSWLEVKARPQSIFVSVTQNETNQERYFWVDMQAGNCHSGFSITQSAE